MGDVLRHRATLKPNNFKLAGRISDSFRHGNIAYCRVWVGFPVTELVGPSLGEGVGFPVTGSGETRLCKSADPRGSPG